MHYNRKRPVTRVATLTKPETQWELKIRSVFITGLSTGVKSGKSNFNFSDKPKFIDAFIFTILIRFSIFKWALILNNSKTFLNKIKSAPFWLNNG